MFAYVENGTVQYTAAALPKGFKNVSGFDLLTPTEQLSYGWYPVVGSEPAFDPTYQTLSAPAYTVNASDVAVSYTVTDFPIDQVKTNKKSAVNLMREQHIQQGITWNGNLFETDIASQGKLTAVVTSVAAGLTLPANFTWRTADNIDVPMTGQDLKDLAQVVLNHVDACYKNSWVHKDAIDVLTTAADVAAYDYTTGWPV